MSVSATATIPAMKRAKLLPICSRRRSASAAKQPNASRARNKIVAEVKVMGISGAETARGENLLRARARLAIHQLHLRRQPPLPVCGGRHEPNDLCLHADSGTAARWRSDP